MLEIETAVFGATHQDFGVGLCEKWKFPKSFASVTGYHHRPMELAPENRTLAAIVYVADRLAADCAGGFRHDLMNTEIDPQVRDFLKLSADKIDELRKNLPEHIKNAGQLLG
jgi:HD-like signal output (HDOD) protein